MTYKGYKITSDKKRGKARAYYVGKNPIPFPSLKAAKAYIDKMLERYG